MHIERKHNIHQGRYNLQDRSPGPRYAWKDESQPSRIKSKKSFQVIYWESGSHAQDYNPRGLSRALNNRPENCTTRYGEPNHRYIYTNEKPSTTECCMLIIEICFDAHYFTSLWYISEGAIGRLWRGRTVCYSTPLKNHIKGGSYNYIRYWY